MRRINDRKQDWWRTTPSHPLGIPSSASILGRCQQIWLMSTSLHKAKCLLFPSSKIWVQPLQWIQLDHAWRLSCAIYTLYCSVYIELLNDRDFWVHQVSPGLIDMTHRHPLIEYSSYTIEPEKLGLTKSLLGPSRMWHLIFCFGQKLTILVFFIMAVLTPQAKKKKKNHHY